MKVGYSFKYKEVRGDLKDKVTFIPKLCLNDYSYKKKERPNGNTTSALCDYH